jgi:hypothetical protein
MAQRAPTVVRVLALPDVREDAERRARGVSIQDWLDAPRPPPRGPDGNHLCDGNEAGCPALRCKFHLGRVGEAAGYSCEWQIVEIPDGDDPNAPCGERTFNLIGRVLGVTRQRVIEHFNSGCHKIEQLPDEEQRFLGVREGHK